MGRDEITNGLPMACHGDRRARRNEIDHSHFIDVGHVSTNDLVLVESCALNSTELNLASASVDRLINSVFDECTRCNKLISAADAGHIDRFSAASTVANGPRRRLAPATDPRWPLKVPHLWPVKLLHPDHRKLIC